MSGSCHHPSLFPSQSNFIRVVSVYHLYFYPFHAAQPPANFPLSAETIDKVNTNPSCLPYSSIQWSSHCLRSLQHLPLLTSFFSLFPCCFLITIFYKWFWVAHQVIASPGTVFSFYLHKHLVISNLPHRSHPRAPFPVPLDQLARLPGLCLSSNYHRLQLDVLRSFHTPAFLLSCI